jgi:hypothetical protein
MTDIKHQMKELAEKLARAHALDFSLASLEKLEAIIAARSVDVETTRIWGAYLGETIRRQRPDITRWIDYDTALGTSSLMRDLPPGPDLEALLQIADRVWFPLSKVEKFQTNGSQDSIAAFAMVALAFARPRSLAEWMQVVQPLESTPVTDEESLEYGPDTCSPRYGHFLRTYGAVRMFDGRLVIQAVVDEVELDSYELLRFATDDGEPVYFLRDDEYDDDEAPVVTLSDGELQHQGEFEDWLLAAFERIGGR